MCSAEGLKLRLLVTIRFQAPVTNTLTLLRKTKTKIQTKVAPYSVGEVNYLRQEGRHLYSVGEVNYLRQEGRHLRRYVTDDCLRWLVMSLIHSRLDCGNFILVGLPAYLHLQSVLNAAARLVFRFRRYDPITDALATLHWLRLPELADF